MRKLLARLQIPFGDVYIGEGPGQLAREYMLTVQKAEQRKVELLEKIADLQRTEYLSSDDVALIQQCINRLNTDDLVELFDVDIDGKIK